MVYSKLDLFSSQFQFNLGDQSIKKGTFCGILLSVFVFLGTLIYSISIIYQYANNQIDPRFKSQTFVEERIDIALIKEFVAFRYEYDINMSLDLFQKVQNKTYIIYVAKFQQFKEKQKEVIQLDVVDCQEPNLIGFKCLDFSKILNYTLSLDTNNSLFDFIEISTYGCNDLDKVKTFTPDNCAEQEDIEKMIDGQNAVLKLKLRTSQYNVSSQQFQTRYRNQYVFTQSTQQIFSRVKVQKQITSVQKGLIVQEESIFSSPISYTQQDLTLERQHALSNIGTGAYSRLLIYPDELVQQTEIQYPSVPKVFTYIYSTYTLLMIFGIIGRVLSQRSIRKDFLMLYLNNIYHQNLFQILKHDPINQQKSICSQQQKKQDKCENKKREILKEDAEKDFTDIKENDDPIFFSSIPFFQNKYKLNLDRKLSAFSNQNDQSNPKLANLDLSMISNEQSGEKQLKFLDELSFSRKESSILKTEQWSQIQNEKLDSFQLQCNQQQKKGLISNTQAQVLSSSNTPEIKKKSHWYQSNQKQISFQAVQEQNESLEKYKQRISEMQSMSLSDKIKKIIFGYRQNYLNEILNQFYFLRICNKKNKNKQVDSFQKQILFIEKQIQSELNIFSFVQDLLFLKKAILLMVNSDQLAALKYIGLSSIATAKNYQSFEDNLEKLGKTFKKTFSFYLKLILIDSCYSHYEKQTLILKSEKLQRKFMEKFFTRCSQSDNLNDLDLKILSQFKQNYENS